jgi:hypothetical protein
LLILSCNFTEIIVTKKLSVVYLYLTTMNRIIQLEYHVSKESSQAYLIN